MTSRTFTPQMISQGSRSRITVGLTRRRESKLRRTKQVKKHAPAARVQRELFGIALLFNDRN